MRQRAMATTPTTSPFRRLRLIIEDPELALDGLTAPTSAFEIATCPGPHDGETCPLVLEGSCALGPPDVVVSALSGPWAPSVRAAWAEAATPVVDASDVATTDPAERLAHHVGAALQCLWGTSPAFPTSGDEI